MTTEPEFTPETTKKIVKVAIRTLVEQFYRSGDLGADFAGTVRAVEGTAAHRKLQKARPEGYRAEVPVSFKLDTPYFILELTGRIDGVLETTEPVTIEEFKTTLLDLDIVVAEDNPAHWAQLKLYGYCYVIEHQLEQVTGQLTYYSPGTGELRELPRTFTLAELKACFNEIIGRYLAWANTREEWYRLRDESIRSLPFPFSTYRAGQRQMAIEVYLAVKQHEQLLVQAPTGIGKTMASVFPALKALGEGHVEKIFYLTGRNTGKIAAADSLARLRKKGLRCKAVTLTAKEKACFCHDIYCQTDACDYARGYYDRIDEACKAAFEFDDLTDEKITELAGKYQVCPFEFSLDISLLADVIICDYNYAFDPRVYLKRYFQFGGGNYAFLIDEAHNLVDRSREMFSAEIKRNDIVTLRRELKPHLPKLYRQLGPVNRLLRQFDKQCRLRGEPFAESSRPEGLLPPLEKFKEEAEKWLMQNQPAAFRSGLLDFFFTVNWFLTVAEKFDERYATCFDTAGNDLSVRLFCLDPSARMREALERAQSTVFFSATLTPTDYFKNLFGCREGARDRAFASPFPPENLCLLLVPSISTLYANRTATVPAVTEMISETIRHKQGNYLLFFPSYTYMQMVYDTFTAGQPDTDTVIQLSSMAEDERAAFLARFNSDNQRTLAGFAVMGGIFGEGIDLVGDRLTGAIIVGVGLPSVCVERELIREYFNRSNGMGFEFAYMYPGLTRVLQAAGRVIRTETDRGIVMLIDERFSANRYRTLLPKEWKPIYVSSADKIPGMLKAFWEK